MGKRIIKDARTGYLMSQWVRENLTDAELDTVIQGREFFTKFVGSHSYTFYLVAGQVYGEC